MVELISSGFRRQEKVEEFSRSPPLAAMLLVYSWY